MVAKPIGDEQLVEQKPLDAGSAGGNTEKLKREPKAGKEKYSDEALAQAQNATQIAPAAAASGATAGAPQGDTPPEAKTAEPVAGGDEVGWIWPANGKTVGTFSEGGNKGVDIAGKAGDSVIAAGDGKVVYSGTGLRGYGKLVIIKHNNTYLSAYAHNQNILVKEGQSVTKGQKIAEMGNTDADQVKLHFEVRRSGKPVDPLKYLPQR
ncbi:MAG: peptidoglycan DD-metalloendopeptidase family protein [Propionivibrio sp.]